MYVCTIWQLCFLCTLCYVRKMYVRVMYIVCEVCIVSTLGMCVVFVYVCMRAGYVYYAYCYVMRVRYVMYFCL